MLQQIDSNMCCPSHIEEQSLSVTKPPPTSSASMTIVSPSPSPSEQTKHVRFELAVEVDSAASPLDKFEKEEEWKTMWYQLDDLEEFRNEARDLCRKMRLLDEAEEQMESNSNFSGPKAPSLAKDAFTRGLEQRMCLERQRRKYLANRFIIKASQSCTEDKLAALARKCTIWATDLAIEEAARDCYRAWSESNIRKRVARPSSSDLDSSYMTEGRRVRARPSPVAVPV